MEAVILFVFGFIKSAIVAKWNALTPDQRTAIISAASKDGKGLVAAIEGLFKKPAPKPPVIPASK